MRGDKAPQRANKPQSCAGVCWFFGAMDFDVGVALNSLVGVRCNFGFAAIQRMMAAPRLLPI
ncbi:hypothetical protein AB4876_12325 [Zhongshania guokunii]|uniref:Uncharacterized protein n=1 Tax=Zhongshania guokunii TaxID=641783 RepID=A0ABV3U6V8_9GAMM